MKGPVFLLAAALAGLLASGCTGPPAGSPPIDNPGLVSLTPTQLEVGGFYAFRHGGGDLVFSTKSNGSADVVLYGADDRRIGRIGVGDAAAAGRFIIEAAPGELVVEVRALEGEGGIDIRSAGARVLRFERLPVHLERHVLLQRESNQLGAGFLTGLLQPQPAEANVDLTLRRAPSTLRLLQHGPFQDLAVVVRGSAGTVLQAEGQGTFGPGFPGPTAFGEVSSTFLEENVRDGALSAQVSASHFEGILLLEAASFSRARPVTADVEPVTEVPRFTYGELPDVPVSFHVRDGTTRLHLFHEGEERDGICPEDQPFGSDEPEEPQACQDAALVALFGPDDRRVATLRVPFDTTVALPVALDQAGEWVAVLLAGKATLGADRVPADFELHPLDVRTAVVPTEAASGGDGQYGQGTASVPPQGIVYRITGHVQGPEVFQFAYESGYCPATGPSLVASQAGETIGVWRVEDQAGGDAAEPMGGIDPNEVLGEGTLDLVYDDFGTECPRMVLSVDSYER